MVQEELGQIEIADDVVTTIASMAAVEVDGIASLAGGHSLAEVWNHKGFKKGISVSTDEHDNLSVIELEVNVEYGVDVYQAATNLQRAVKQAVEGMTGLRVKSVNVKVAGIVLGPAGTRRPAADAPAREEKRA